jgi:hypothetical protein
MFVLNTFGCVRSVVWLFRVFNDKTPFKTPLRSDLAKQHFDTPNNIQLMFYILHTYRHKRCQCAQSCFECRSHLIELLNRIDWFEL